MAMLAENKDGEDDVFDNIDGEGVFCVLKNENLHVYKCYNYLYTFICSYNYFNCMWWRA